jgi:hypothetical protein
MGIHVFIPGRIVQFRDIGIDDIVSAGDLRYAPMSWESEQGEVYHYADDFFPVFQNKILVVNGINMQTNAHRPGQVNSFQGTFASGFPTLAAAFCAAKAPDLLMGYLATANYRSTGGLIPYTAINQPDLLLALIEPFLQGETPKGMFEQAPDEREGP